MKSIYIVVGLLLSDIFNRKKSKKYYLTLFLNKISQRYRLLNLTSENYSLKFNRIKLVEVEFSRSLLNTHINNLSISFYPLKKTRAIFEFDTITVTKIKIKESKNANIKKNDLTLKLNSFLEVFNRQKLNNIKIKVNKLSCLFPIEVCIQDISLSSTITKFQITSLNRLKSKYQVCTTQKNSQLSFSVKRTDHNCNDIISVNSILGKFNFDTKNKLFINCSLNVNDIIINHKRVSNIPFKINRCKILSGLSFNNRKIELSEETIVEIDGITLNISHSLDLDDPDVFSLYVISQFKPESIIQLIPSLNQKDLRKLRSEGDIVLAVQFGCLKSDPLTHKFDLKYELNNFSIDTPGVDLNYLLSDFQHNNFPEYATTQKSKTIKPDHFNRIKYKKLENTILLSEDPLFFNHKGFDIFNIGVAIASNLANKKFSRGASTITMQIVKNLLLDNSKSISRKIEEMILTLLIETHFEIDKETLLNIYMQLIKFSPNIYGIENGAQYYFNKQADKLTTMECIVLSYIIPRPDYFEEAVLINSKQLNKNLSLHTDRIINSLISQSSMRIEDVTTISPRIEFHNNLGQIELEYSNILKNNQTG